MQHFKIFCAVLKKSSPPIPGCARVQDVNPEEAFPQPPAAEFPPTNWSVVQAASKDDSPAAQDALERLCRAYWYPLYAYVRRRGYKSDDAQDLTQSFFARLLQKDYLKLADRQRGRFRTFLRTALERFLADEWDRAHRLKRGGGQTAISFDALDAEERYRLEPAVEFDAARMYDRRWATTLLERTLARLETEQAETQHSRTFNELKRFLIGETQESSYAEVASRLGMTITAVRMAVSRLRRRYRELLLEELGQTVRDSSEIREECRALMAAFQH